MWLTLNDVQSTLTNAWYMTIIDARCHNLKYDKKSSCLTLSTCTFGRYTFTRLPFGVALGGDMFQRKIDEIFRGLPNGFGITYDILIVGYDADDRDHYRTLRQMIQI